jgi:AP2 domain
VRTIPLRGAKANGRVAFVDDDDADLVAQHMWSVREVPAGYRGRTLPYGPFAITKVREEGRLRTVFMHNLILGTQHVGHRNGLGLDNRRANLAIGASSARRPSNGKSSPYVGVNARGARWRARLNVGGKRQSIGDFATEVEAALAYDAAARKVFGDQARLNFPGAGSTAATAAAAQELAALSGAPILSIRERMDSLAPADEAEIVRRYQARETSGAIADAYGVWGQSVIRLLRRRGVTIRDMHERGDTRHDALDTLTPEAAYWCGVLFSDGCVTYRRGWRSPQVVLALTAGDRAHVEKLRDFLGAGHLRLNHVPGLPVRGIPCPPGRNYMGKPTCRLSVTSSPLAERLLLLGRYEGSLDWRLAMSRDFWRGMIDGDGHVSLSGGFARVALYGSRRVLEEYAAFVNTFAGPRPLNVHWRGTTHAVVASHRKAERIVGALYEDADLALERKARVAAEIIKRGALHFGPPSLGGTTWHWRCG